MGLRKIRSFIAVYKKTEAGKTWKADFSNMREAQAYINSKKRPASYLIYEGFLAQEEEVGFKLPGGLKLEGIFKAETEEAISF